MLVPTPINDKSIYFFFSKSQIKHPFVFEKYAGHLFGKNKFGFFENSIVPPGITLLALFQNFCPLLKLKPSSLFISEFI